MNRKNRGLSPVVQTQANTAGAATGTTALANPTYASPRTCFTLRWIGTTPAGKPPIGRYSAASWMKKP